MINHKNLTFGLKTREVYKPLNFSSEADICLNHCPQPNKSCKGTCAFYEAEMAKIRGTERRPVRRA